MKLALGTAQFGMTYGIANTDGKVTEQAAKKILHRAKEAGINILDTAAGYGSSEYILGKIGINDWRIVTKLPALPEECLDVSDWVNEQFTTSLKKLGVRNVSSLMLHRPIQLLEPKGQELWSAIQTLKKEGLVKKIGYSIYSPDELDALWDRFQPDIIQSPYNIIDQRLKTSGWLDQLDEVGVEVHIRSIFLQGLLLLGLDDRPDRFFKWNKLWRQWDNWLSDNQLTAIQVCINFALSESKISHVVVGVDNIGQLNEVLDAIDMRLDCFPNDMSMSDLELINPSNWSMN